MIDARMRFSTLRLIAGLSFRAAVCAPLVIATTLVSCADENDPQTWVKRLDDPAQRPAAIRRLSQFFEDGMTHANKNRGEPMIRSLLDKIVEPMTRQYVAGNLDEKTRKELMKSLADTRDPRAAPALAKALNEYEPGKNDDDDVKYAVQSINGMAAAGTLRDTGLVDGLWNAFSKFRVSKAKSLGLVKDLHDAVLAVKHPSYGPKAVDKLSAPVDPSSAESKQDQLQFWQLTSVQLISELRFAPAARSLVTVLLTPSKASELRSTVNTALMKMPLEAEPLLISALGGTDPEFAKLATAFGPQKMHVAFLADALSWISRPAGREAYVTALNNADNDANRALMAAMLMRFPSEPRLVSTFLTAYKKVPPGSNVALVGGNARGALAQAAALFYDPSLVDWLLKEAADAKGDDKDALPDHALEAAVKLMRPSQVKAVANAIAKDKGAAREKEMFDQAAPTVQKCGEDAACYVAVLDEPIPSSPRTANMRAIKAAWSAGTFGSDATRQQLVGKVDKVKDSGARLALVEAIDHLAPKGDSAAADALDKIVEADKASGNPRLLAADDAVVKVALRLRARAMP